MRNAIIISTLIATPCAAQVTNPPIIRVDTSQFATKTAVDAAAQAAADAKRKADDAAAAVNATVRTVNGVSAVNGNVAITLPTVPDMSAYATTAAVNAAISAATAGTIKTVNGATAVNGNLAISLPTMPDLSPYATTTSVTTAINSATAAMVKTVNGSTPNASGAVTIALPVNRFLTGTYTVDTLPTPSATYVNMYADVTDLFGSLRDYVRCIQVGSSFYWRPVAQTYAATAVSLASGNYTVMALKTPPIIIANGTLLADRTITLSTVGAYPGATVDVAFDGNLGLFGITIKSGVGTTLGTVISGGRKRFVFANNDWYTL